MGDMNIHAYRWCSSNVQDRYKVRRHQLIYGPTPRGPYQYGWRCSCKGFQFRKDCKHIAEAERTRCKAGQEAAMGVPTEMGKTCPDCGGPTSVITVAV